MPEQALEEPEKKKRNEDESDGQREKINDVKSQEELEKYPPAIADKKMTIGGNELSRARHRTVRRKAVTLAEKQPVRS